MGLARTGKGGMKVSLSNGCDGHVIKTWQRLLYKAVQKHKHQR